MQYFVVLVLEMIEGIVLVIIYFHSHVVKTKGKTGNAAIVNSVL